jgi:hypothetical protein
MGHGDGSINVMAHGICPGGECSTGGEWSQGFGYVAVPRPLACSLCRYRLTGPMFLPGLVLNANRLMHELRRKGQEIASLNEERESLTDAGKPIHGVGARIEALYRETDTIAAEWAAEVQYVDLAEKMFEGVVAQAQGKESTMLPMVVTGMDQASLECQLDQRSEFALLQSLAEGAATWPGFRPAVAIDDHREFLNEVLSANDMDPFLLRLKGETRDRSAVLLGRTIAAMVPDDKIDDLRSGVSKLEEYPEAERFFRRLGEQVLTLGLVDEHRLLAEVSEVD